MPNYDNLLPGLARFFCALFLKFGIGLIFLAPWIDSEVMAMRQNDKLQRVIAFLDREEIDYLDKIGKDALFTRGVKLSRVKVLRAMVDAMRDLEINGKDISSESELKEEILKKVTEYKEGGLE